jgi:hypothetical protein
MSPETLEAIRAFSQFAGGARVGFVVSIVTTYLNTRARLMQAVLTEAEKEQRTLIREPRVKSDRAMPFVVVLVMAALLLAGVSWMKSGQQNSEERRQDCLRSAEVSRVLRDRTKNYRDAAVSERRLWLNMRRQLRTMGTGPHSPLIENIDTYLADQATYLEHLKDNPYPRESVKDC